MFTVYLPCLCVMWVCSISEVSKFIQYIDIDYSYYVHILYIKQSLKPGNMSVSYDQEGQ